MPAPDNHEPRRRDEPFEIWEPVEEAEVWEEIAQVRSPALELVGLPFEPDPDTLLDLELPVPEAVVELARYDTIVDLDDPDPPAKREPLPRATTDHKRIVAWLDVVGSMTTEQVHRACAPYVSRRSLQLWLAQLHQAGLVQRRRAQLSARARRGRGGSAPLLWSLTAKGFAQGVAWRDPEGEARYWPQIADYRRWRRSTARFSKRLTHDLHAVHWALAFDALLREWESARIDDLYTPRYLDGQLRPRRRQSALGGRWRGIELREIELPTGYVFEGISSGPFERAINPDLTLHVWIDWRKDDPREVDLLVELDRTRRPAYNRRKLIASDEFLTGWCLSHQRVRESGRPVVIFVCPDDARVRALMKVADECMTGRIGQPGEPDYRWRYPGREHMLFTSEEKIHHGSMLALRLPQLPRRLRWEPDETYRTTLTTILPLELVPERLRTSPWGA